MQSYIRSREAHPRPAIFGRLSRYLNQTVGHYLRVAVVNIVNSHSGSWIGRFPGLSRAFGCTLVRGGGRGFKYRSNGRTVPKNRARVSTPIHSSPLARVPDNPVNSPNGSGNSLDSGRLCAYDSMQVAGEG